MNSKCPVPSPLLPYFFGLPFPYKYVVALFLAVFLDLLDFMVIGLFPPLSWIINFFGILVLLPFAGVPVLFSVMEFMPLLEVMPIFTFSVLISAGLEKTCSPLVRGSV